MQVQHGQNEKLRIDLNPKQMQDLMHCKKVQHGQKRTGLVSSPSMGRPGPQAGPGRGQAQQHHPDLQVDQVIAMTWERSPTIFVTVSAEFRVKPGVGSVTAVFSRPGFSKL